MLALLMTLTLLAGQPQIQRPTPIEVAAAVYACSVQATGEPLLVTGNYDQAHIERAGETVISFFRGRPPNPRYFEIGAEYWREDDPVDPPMVIATRWQSRLTEPPRLGPGLVACLDQEYPRLL